MGMTYFSGGRCACEAGDLKAGDVFRRSGDCRIFMRLDNVSWYRGDEPAVWAACLQTGDVLRLYPYDRVRPDSEVCLTDRATIESCMDR